MKEIVIEIGIWDHYDNLPYLFRTTVGPCLVNFDKSYDIMSVLSTNNFRKISSYLHNVHLSNRVRFV